MKPTHHPHDSTILSYAAGSLPHSQSIIMACHIHLCSQCQERLQQAELLGSHLLTALPSMAVSPAIKNQCLHQLHQPIHAPTPATQTASVSTLPSPVTQLMTNDYLDSRVWKTVAPGIKQHVLLSESSQQLRALIIGPQQKMPLHSHSGSEITLVLKGSYSDETGNYSKGDVSDLDENTHHQPVVGGKEPCICLVATEGPLKFIGWLPKVLQPFLGF